MKLSCFRSLQSKAYTSLSVKTTRAWSSPETGKFGSVRPGRVQGEQPLYICCLVCHQTQRDGAEISLSLIAWVKTPPCPGKCPWKGRVQHIPIGLRGIIDSSPLLHPMSTWQQCINLTWLGLAQGGFPPPQDIPGVSFISALKLKIAMSAKCYYCLPIWSMCSWP